MTMTTKIRLLLLCVLQLSGLDAQPRMIKYPPWPPTYIMKESLITMQCNSSGWSSPRRGAEFGIVSYDWSNAKAQWAKRKPMDCEERLLKQAIMTKNEAATNKTTRTSRVFVYRNLVKALPWFTTVRDKLDDPSYAGFFLKFDPSRPSYHVPPCAAENSTHCSIFYHDQLQTPQVPTPNHPHPDGSCGDDYCDCGVHPCGEYLFDYRNGTMLQDFLVEEVILGAIQHEAVDGVFLDDYWCSDLLCNETNNSSAFACPCNDPIQGPTEVDPNSTIDMGLSDEDIRDLTLGWQSLMVRVKRVLLENKAYTWSLMADQDHANAMPTLLSPNTTECRALLREACCCRSNVNSPWQVLPKLFGFSVVNGTQMVQLQQDLAFFLLARGPYTWAGWGTWGMGWPFNAEPAHGALPPLPHGVPLPPEFDLDYGIPLEVCYEVSFNSNNDGGIFRRQWSNVTITLDCNTFEAKFYWRRNSIATHEEKAAMTTA